MHTEGQFQQKTVHNYIDLENGREEPGLVTQVKGVLPLPLQNLAEYPHV